MTGKKRTQPSLDRVSVVCCDSYDAEEVYESIRQGLEDIKFRIRPGMSVLLKPNILAQNYPYQATTTHPSVVDAVCRILSSHKCTITIGDSSAFYQGGGTRRGFETSGMSSVAEKYNARLLPFEATRLRKITTGTVLNPFYLTEAVFEHDLVINLPKLKVHRLARYTGALKNIYGCVPGGTKQVYHKMFQDLKDYQEQWGKPLVDVYEAVTPGLTIMDGIIGLDKDGPAANGEPRKTGVILASENGAALDVVVCQIIGFDPHWVPAVREALTRGLTSLERIKTIGKIIPKIQFVKLPDLKPKKGIWKTLDQYLFDQFIVEPRIAYSACEKCDKCIDNCAVKAVNYNMTGYPAIDYSKCIYCYCCEEYCPYKAVFLQGSNVNYLIRGIRWLMKL